MNDYYLNKHNDESTASLYDSLVYAFGQTVGTKEGRKSMMLGFLTGGMGGARSNKARRIAQDKRTERVINLVNTDVENAFNSKLGNAERSALYAKRMQEAEEAGDIEAWKDNHFALIASQVASAVENGGFEVLMEKLEDAKDMTEILKNYLDSLKMNLYLTLRK
jgi:hypothetical protein